MPAPPKASSPLHPSAFTETSIAVPETQQNPELLVDEADALFRRRSEVHDANDRYSNDSTDPGPHKP